MKRMRGVAMLLALPVVLPAAAVVIWTSGMPQNVAGMAAHTVCSGAFVAGRPWRDVWRDDLLAANRFFGLLEVDADAHARTVVARVPGGVERRASLQAQRGCVLDPTPSEATAPGPTPPAPPPQSLARQPRGDASVLDDRVARLPMLPATDTAPHRRHETGAPAAHRAAPGRWPQGDDPWPAQDWAADIDAARLQAVADAAMAGQGDAQASNARGLAIVHRGRLLVRREAPGFENGTPLHGWSMSKTVIGLLIQKLAADQQLVLEGPLVDWFPAAQAPAWVAEWRHDARRQISVADLLYMREGLDNRESYMPWSAVPRMLFGEDDVAGYAAQAHAEARPGERWRYSSFSSNLLARALRARFHSDAAYWAYPAQALFGPIGARSATIETDRDGTWMASSYLWASTADWARIGQLLLADGRWGERQVLPSGVLQRTLTPSRDEGEGRRYGAQIWRLGDLVAGDCRGQVPEDTLAMTGHWGQIVAIVPSREAVITRLGWTVAAGSFDACRLVADVLAALPAPTHIAAAAPR